MYAWLLKPLLFLLSPERAHHLAMAALKLLGRMPGVRSWLERRLARRDPALKVCALGMELDSPVGLAAGLDKNAEAFHGLGALGFGFVEVGTLTPKPQPGAARPRLFRLPLDRALVNRMGFNNCGVDAAAARLAAPRDVIVGANVGKNRTTPNEAAAHDYVAATRAVAAHVAYLVVNVSSPNTPALRALQATAELRPLLTAVRDALTAAVPGRRVPLLVKISPDLSDAELDAIADLVLELGLEGIIATNTTLSRAGLRTPSERVEACGDGGLSGAPLAGRAFEVLRRLRDRVQDRVTLVSVGGIEDAEDVWQRLSAGATLVQIYTALIYEGPALVGRINAELAERARTSGYERLVDAVRASRHRA
jgi:dihydroorotate dehydrogenase